jgi:putative ABC transport system permease protein
MVLPSPPLVLRLCLRWLGLVARVAPRSFREDWRQEWEAEVRHRWEQLSERGRIGWASQLDLARRALGALPDAAWLRQQLTADAELMRDARHGLRLLRRNLGFTCAAVLILAVGIGANTAIFSAVDALLLRDPPYPEPDRIVLLWQRDLRRGLERVRDDVAPANFADWRERTRAFAVMAAADPYAYDLLGAGEPEVLFGARVTEGFFEVFQVQPLLGRTFRPEDHVPGAPPVVVLGHGIWQRRFAGDAAIVGRVLSLDEGPHTVIGVLPPHFQPGLLPTAGERGLWVPKTVSERERRIRGSAWWNVVGRIKPGLTLAQAQADMDVIAAGLGREHPRTNREVAVALQPLQEHLAGEGGPALVVLWAAVALVLAVACANVAGLLLARGAQRQHEFAVRAALGASRGRLLRQLVAEGLLLAGLGSLAGVVLARWGVQGLVRLLPPDLPRLDQVGVHGRVLLFTTAVAVLTGVFFGLAPAWRVLAERGLTLRAGARTTVGSRPRRRLGGTLVVGEVALALVLLAGASLLLRSFTALRSVDPGFRAERVLMLQVFAWDRNRTPEQRAAFFAQSLDRIAGLPGVAAAAAVSSLPFASVDFRIESPLVIEGRPVAAGEEASTFVTVATPDYLRTVAIPLRRGRWFSAADNARGAPVAVINEALARLHWPGQDPVGARVTVRWLGQPVAAQIVGVVGAVRHEGLHRAPRSEVLLPHAQVPSGTMCYVVRTEGEAAAAAEAVKKAIWAIDPMQSFYQTATLDRLVAQSLAPRRSGALLLAGFAAVAVGLAAMGLHALIAFSTRLRTREIGVRMALGAERSDIVRLVMGQGVGLVGAGMVVGLAGALALGRFVRGLLFGVSASDPYTLAGVSVLLGFVSLGAAFVSARGAARLDPLDALRADSP